MTPLRNHLAHLREFYRDRLWQVRLDTLPRHRAAALRLLRILQLTLRGFREDNCPMRASSLTFYSLLSVVPTAAMAFGIAKGFGFEKLLEAQLLEHFPGQEAVVAQIVNFARAMLENTRGGMIAGIGVAVLFWAVVKVLSQIEAAFNRIWQVAVARSAVRKLTDYLSIMLICPLLVIMSGSATVFITTQVQQITERIALLGMFSPLIALGLKLIPYVLIWILFTFVYLTMPNTRVRLGAGLVAGVLAGTVYQITQWGYITFQVGVARQNAIYGSFAALPLFLVWLQLSWLIVLVGAEFAFAVQNFSRFEWADAAARLDHRQHQLLCLQTAQRIVKGFVEGQAAPTPDSLAAELGLPVVLARRIVDDLVASGLFVYLQSENSGQPACQPAKDVRHYTIAAILEALENRGDMQIPGPETCTRKALTEALQSMTAERSASPANRRLADLE
jgi:membrane protein